jgi:hypothetical protein
MAEDTTPPFDLAIARQVDALCEAFERARRRGDRADLGDWLARAGDLAPHALADLAVTDLELRLAAGEAARVEEYLGRFPALGQDMRALFGLVEAEYRHRREREPDLSAEAVRARFPALAAHPLWESGPWFAGETPQPGPTDAPGSSERLSFLDPPGEQGELGRLDGYPVLGLLGGGGMGLVLLARDPRLGRQVAIKVMRPEAACLPAAKERFLREARAAAEVEHERVIAIYHVGEAAGRPYLVMPLLRGESLADRLRREPALPVAEVLRLGREMAEGLAAAHARGLIHRDVKPGNVWLEAAGDDPARPPRVKLLDFGLARPRPEKEQPPESELTQTGMVVGTPLYMAPEQAAGSRVDARADLFSLGVVLYLMGAGRRPPTGLQLLQDAAPEPPDLRAVNPAVPPGLSSLVRRLLARTPDDRPESAAAVVEELRKLETAGSAPTEAFLGAVPAGAGSVPGARASRQARWRQVALAVLLLGVVAGLGVWRAVRTPAPSVPAGKVAFKGDITALLTSEKDGKFGLALHDPDALPARDGYQFRVEARVEPEAYLYILAIDEEGKATPLYPWQPDRWGTRPADGRRVGSVSLPANQEKGWTIRGPKQGMIALVMLARDTPLDVTDDDLRALLDGLPAQRPLPGRRAAVWFEDGREVRDEPDRQRTIDFTEEDLNNPVVRLQTLIRQKLQPHASYTRAVTFAKEGN